MNNNKELWEDILGKKEWGKYPSEELIRFIAKNFYSKDRKNIEILELGVGGQIFGILLERGLKYMELSGVQVDVNKQKNYYKKTNC